MARLEYQITGSVTGLQSAGNIASGILAGLKQQADALKIDLFGAKDVANINAIGNALTTVTGQISAYTAEAIRGSQAFKDQSAQAALDNLSTKLNVIAGNSLLFGDSIQYQQQEIKAYQAAISSLFASGLDPLDVRVTTLKGKIDTLTASIQAQQAATAGLVPTAAQNAVDTLAARLKVLNGNAYIFGTSIQNNQAQIRAYQTAIEGLIAAGVAPFDARITGLKGNIDRLTASISAQKAAASGDPFARYAITGNLIQDAERKVRNLTEALRLATDERGIERYNKRLQAAQVELARLNAIGLTSGQQAQRASMGYNSLGTELARIGQDAPFAFKALGAGADNFGAIGNNITRLVELVPGYIAQTSAVIVANGGVATSANVAKAALAGLFTGFGAVVLGVSLAVSAFTIYSNLQQRAAREAKEAAEATQKQDNALSDYIKTLSTSERASASAASGYATEVTKLDTLYRSLLNNADARYQNNTALNELQKSWPAEFANLQKGVEFTTQLSNGYKSLRENLVNLGISQAAQSLSADASKRLVQSTIAFDDAQQRVKDAKLNLESLIQAAAVAARSGGDTGNVASQAREYRNQIKAAEESVKTYRIEVFKANQEISKFGEVTANANSKLTSPIDKGLQQQLEKQIASLEQQRKFSTDANQIAQLNVDIKAKQAELDALLGRNTKDRTAEASKELSINQQIAALKDKINARVQKSGLTGYTAEVKEIELAYKGLDTSISNIIASIELKRGKKGGLSNTKAYGLIGNLESVRATLAPAMSREIGDAQIKEAKRVSDEVTRINNEFGVKAQESKGRELFAINARYDAEVAKAGTNATLLSAIETGRLVAVQAVNDKYAAIEADLQAKILGINEQTAAFLSGKEDEQTNKIEREFDNRRAALNRYYEDLIKLTTVDITPGGGNDLDALLKRGQLRLDQSTDNYNLGGAEDKKVLQEKFKDINSALSGTLTGFSSGLRNSLFNASSQAGYDFKSVFSGVTTSFAATLQNGVFSLLEKKLADAIKSGTSGLSGALQGAIAGLAIAGGLVSGLTPKTSAVGQGLGGALSGAAAGIAVGSAVPGIGTLAGGVVGGLVGLVGGIFGASKAQKELQEKQLAEAKQQTDLLRQSIAYTAAVIGRNTDQGVITGVEVGAFGQLTTTVAGSDLNIILKRTDRRR